MIQIITAPRLRAFLATTLAALLIVACGGGGGGGAPAPGGGGGGSTPPATAHRVSADVSGLRGAGLVLSLDQAEDVTVTGNGSISFARQIAAGQSFSLVVKTQPTGPAQYCTVEATVQPIDSDTTVAVRCEFPPPKFAYVGTSNGIDVMRADAATGALALVQNIDLPRSDQLVLTEDQSLLIVGRDLSVSTNAELTTYRVNGNTGLLTPTQATPVRLGTRAARIAMHPNGSLVYVAEPGLNLVQWLRLDSVTGQLSTGSLVEVLWTPSDIAISPDGRFAYVAYENGLAQTFAVDAATGELTEVQTISTGLSNAQSVALDPQQRYAYFGGSDGTSSFGLDPVAGMLTPINKVQTRGVRLAVHPSGDYLYAFALGGELATFAVGAGTGELVPVGARTPTPSPRRLAAAGRFLMAASYDFMNISVFTLDAATGQPAWVGSTPTSSGASDVVISTQR